MKTIITTVGTSLTGNYAKENKEMASAQTLSHFLRHTEAERACAETNSLHRLLKGEERGGIVFLHSTTEEGALCADALARHYKNMGYESISSEIADLSYKESRFKMLGLRALVAKMIEIINAERKKGNDVIINATGGFKAEIAYATLIGLLFDIPVYYMHEKFQEIIEMPPVPVAWDYSLFIYHEDFIAWLNTELRTKAEVEPRLKSLPADLKFLLSEEDGYFTLSPAGEVFYEACKAREASCADVPVFLSARARRTFDSATADERVTLNGLIGKLRDKIIRRNQSSQKNNSDCFVFPGGHFSQRVFFFEDEEGFVHVCDVALSHDVYDRMLDKRGIWRKEFDGFEKFSY